MKRWLALTLALLSAVLLTLSFPRFDLGYLAWFAFVPLLFAIEDRSAIGAFGLGWLAGTAFFIGTTHWVTNTMIQYGKLNPLLSYPVMLLLSVYLGLYVGVFAGFYTSIRERAPETAFLFAPLAWTSLELLRTHALSGFPWASLGYSQYQTLPMIQIADLTGVYGVSFLLMLANIAAAEFLMALRDFRFQLSVWRPALVAALAAGLVYGYGVWRLDLDRASDPPTLKVGVVQANIPQDLKWDAGVRQVTLYRYASLTRKFPDQSVRLAVWPEAAMPFFFDADAAYRQQVVEVAQAVRIPILFGSPGMLNPSSPRQITNSAFLLSDDGKLLGRYDKMHLVPFGEYVPLSGMLSFVNKMVEGIGDFVPGLRPTVFELPEARVGAVICYEVIFPDLVRRFVRDGAQVMTTITNDAWFGVSSAPYQHFSTVVFRAVENRVPFARAANTGISGFVDRTGRIRQASGIFEEAALTDTLRLHTDMTFYTRFGDIFAFLCVIMASLMMLRAMRS